MSGPLRRRCERNRVERSEPANDSECWDIESELRISALGVAMPFFDFFWNA
jgi:hypothetical protein